MALRYYAIAQLQALGKAAIRALLPTVGTESGADLAIIPDTAALMFQGAQVAAAHVEEQIFPATANAETLQKDQELRGIDFTREATKARGYVMVGNKDVNQYEKLVSKGTTFEFPASAFIDGIARTFVAIEDGFFRAELDSWAPGATVGHGNSSTKMRMRTARVRRGDVPSISGAGTTLGTAVARRADPVTLTTEFFSPIEVDLVDGNTVNQGVRYQLVAVEAQDAGADGNCTSVVFDLTTSHPPAIACSDETLTNAWVVESGGGGDAVGEIDEDSARVVRVLEDFEAAPPGAGNPEHWREIAVKCPTVDLDDAIVYMGVRGPGTIDIVGIGRSGQNRSTDFPAANIGHLAHNGNRRRIGELGAAELTRWCNFLPDGTRRSNYFDDVLCHSVEWDRRGPQPSHYSTVEFLRSASAIAVTVFTHPGYGPDMGEYWEFAPHTQSMTRLYPASSGDEVPANMAVGQRVSVTFKSAASEVLPFASIVTTIIGIDASRKFVTVADMTAVASAMMSRGTDARILTWRTAGPLDQAVEDAFFGYFDEMGPGSYTTVPFDPGIQAQAAAVQRSTVSSRLERWPDEARRWPGSLRASTLKARIGAIQGVHSVLLENAAGGPLVDFDPAPMQTLLPAGIILAVKPAVF